MKNTIFTFEQIINWLIIYRYWLFLPFVIIEGPIITIIAGFLASLGYFNIFLLYIIVVFLDLFEDSLIYLLGKFWGKKFVNKFGAYFGINNKRFLLFKKHFKRHSKKAIIIGKLPVVGFTWFIPLIAAGMTKMPFHKYMSMCFLTSLPKSLFLLLIGYYFGKFYVTIDKYLNYFGWAITVLIILIILIYFVIAMITRRMLNEGDLN